jgi:type II secretory pathway pseudopilin PulG
MTGKQRGYTIVEVLIFIAVTAMIFVAAMSAVGGRQQQVQFAQGLREFESKLQDVMNDVTTGYYPSNTTIGCSVSLLGKTEVDFSSVGQKLGSNSDCVYFGKAIQILPNSAEYPENDTKIVIYNLVGKRYLDSNGERSKLAKNIDEATPVAVANGTAGDSE